MVQIGNVWTPPELRGRGYARAVVAGALQYARRRGVADAILFTGDDNHAAQQAYVALGFTRIGDYAILLFADRSEEHTSELQSLMSISYPVFCLKKKNA